MLYLCGCRLVDRKKKKPLRYISFHFKLGDRENCFIFSSSASVLLTQHETPE